MDHITIPAVVRTRAGVDAVTLELGRVDGWAVLAPAESGGPEFVVDECTMTRLVTAWGTLTSGGR